MATNKPETIFDYKEHLEMPPLQKFLPVCDELDIEKSYIPLRDGTKIYCERDGKNGEPIVFIHGGPGASHQGFHGKAITELAKSNQVILYDQAGCGDTESAKNATYSVDKAVDQLEELREKLGYDKWAVLGHSYGGTIAYRYAEKYPERVSSLILEAPFCAGLPIDITEKPKSNFISENEKQRIKEIMDRTDIPEADKIIYAQMCGAWKRQSLTMPTYEEFCRIPYECSFNKDFLTATNNDVDSLVENTKSDRVFKNDHNIPVTIMWGKYDWTLPGTPEGLQKCIKNSHVEIFEQANHGLHKDMPERFVDVVRDATNSKELKLDGHQNSPQDLQQKDDLLSLPNPNQDEAPKLQKEKGTSKGKGGERGHKNYRGVLINQIPQTAKETATKIGNTAHRVEKTLAREIKQRTLNLGR